MDARVGSLPSGLDCTLLVRERKCLLLRGD